MTDSSRKTFSTLLNSEKALQEFYDALFPSLEKYILMNSGTSDDAKDVFQEAMVIAYRKIQDPDFTMTSKLETFVFSIAKRKWLHELRKRKKTIPILDVIDDSKGNNIDEIVINSEKSTLYLKHFNGLTESCREILNLFFSGMKIPEITKKLNFGSEGYTRKRKHNCQKKLIKSIRDDELFNELKYE